jgi:hypothetical protein
MNYDMFGDGPRARAISEALRQAGPVLGEVGAALAPGSGLIDAGGGYYSPMQGRRTEGFGENLRGGDYGMAGMQALGAGGDLAMLAGPLGLAAGTVMKLPKALSRGAAVSKELRAAARAEKAAAKEAEKVARAAAKAQAKAAEQAEILRTSQTDPTLDKKQAKAFAAAAGEPDVGLSAATSFPASRMVEGRIPREAVEEGLANRARLRQEEPTLPKRPEEMSDQEWVDWGNQYGADFSQSPMQSLPRRMSDVQSKQEVMIPGGLEGTFTLPDLFRIKGQNFDPGGLDQATHNQLMQKFLRTYDKPEPDEVDVYNALNFALMSPNTPLTQNEFMAMRLRARTPEDLEAIGSRSFEAEPRLKKNIEEESGIAAAYRGGMGVGGTPDPGHGAMLARLLRESPEMFKAQAGETMREAAFRVMNQVPGLSVKTASLGMPMTDLGAANTSAVDLHMIRNNYKRLMDEMPDFRERVNALTGTERKKGDKSKPLTEEEAAIQVISSHPGGKYRYAGGELNPDLPDYMTPEKLAYEPESFTVPSPYYSRIMEYIDEGRGANPEIELFPEQWRKWDQYRGRVEPHEMMHPDYRKLPKQSFTEMQDALRSHKEAGYTTTHKMPGLPEGVRPDMGFRAATQVERPTDITSARGASEAEAEGFEIVRRSGLPKQADWRKLYYGHADPRLLMAVTGAGLAGTGLTGMVRNKKEAMEEQGLTNADRSRY